MSVINKTIMTGVNKLLGQLRDRAAKAAKDANVSAAVGYTAAYALPLHEMPLERAVNLGKQGPRKSRGVGHPGHGFYWGPSGGPKFLEGPFRLLSNARELSRIVITALKRKTTLAQALVLAALRVQRESMKKVPVDLGNLRAAAWTRLEVPARSGTGQVIAKGEAGA